MSCTRRDTAANLRREIHMARVAIRVSASASRPDIVNGVTARLLATARPMVAAGRVPEVMAILADARAEVVDGDPGATRWVRVLEALRDRLAPEPVAVSFQPITRVVPASGHPSRRPAEARRPVGCAA